jgi:hypothetical protein
MTEAVRVRILVAIDDNGKWSACGYYSNDDAATRDVIFIDDIGEHLSYHWVEADIPIPTPLTINGVVTEDAQ